MADRRVWNSCRSACLSYFESQVVRGPPKVSSEHVSRFPYWMKVLSVALNGRSGSGHHERSTALMPCLDGLGYRFLLLGCCQFGFGKVDLTESAPRLQVKSTRSTMLALDAFHLQ